ncbi:hypothetical protein Cgig2_018919 [Carnegiea gigantea]|uniref:Uncharacterized protein n=1 Tax=Carnegiea gigantea TaxID=171969 RepID=A0A9Q1GUI7_9CARY|nr:hypothetical protein Cgig2_018919 [Carnegiea gigantea]
MLRFPRQGWFPRLAGSTRTHPLWSISGCCYGATLHSLHADFEWYCQEVAFPPPLSSDYEDLCHGFDLAVTEEYTRDAPGLGGPLTGETQRLGRGGELGVERAASGPFCRVAGPLYLGHYGVRDRRLPGYVPGFTLLDAEEAVCDFVILEIVQAMFYGMLVNDAMELSVASRDMARDLKSTLKGLWWTTFESWLSVNKHALLEMQFRRRAHPGGGLGPANDPEKSLGSNDCSAPSSDE